MKTWEGEHVFVSEGLTWWFHTCLRCGRPLSSTGSTSGYGANCERLVSPAERDVERRRALASDRRRYRTEVLDLGFKVGGDD